MTLTVKASYENGILKPFSPLPLDEHEHVLITIHSKKSRAEMTAGLMGWTGSVAEADYYAMDPDLAFPPPPEEQ